MPDADRPTAFAHLADGTILLRQRDGGFRAVPSETDAARLRTMSEAEIEHHAANNPGHLRLDAAFWAEVDARPLPENAIRLDPDVLSHFRRDGGGYEGRINAVLRRYVEDQIKR